MMVCIITKRGHTMFFFFSSRRRHTRCSRDWSSDVCSSDLGIALLRPDELDPLRTTTRGVGELIWEAGERGAKVVVVGLGGSATVDGGTGAARGLGWTFQDARGETLPEGGGTLAQLADLGGGWGVPAQVLALTDVNTPLIGAHGAALVFAPQKGAGPEGVKLLSRGLERLAKLMARHGRPELGTLPGGGAAGG